MLYNIVSIKRFKNINKTQKHSIQFDNELYTLYM